MTYKALGFAIFMVWEVGWWRFKLRHRTLTYWLIALIVAVMVTVALYVERRKK